jgi:hypothetical protein
MGSPLAGRSGELQRACRTSIYVFPQVGVPSITADFVPSNITATTAAAGATTLTVSALPNKILKGTVLQFIDPNDISYIAKVSSDTNASGTSLPVTALMEAIPTGAIATWPIEIMDRTDLTINESMTTQDLQTFNSSCTKMIVAMTGEWSVEIPGPLVLRNAGYFTATYFGRIGQPMWFLFALEQASQDQGKITPLYYYGQGYVTQFNKENPADNFRNANLTISGTGELFEIFPENI